MLTYIKIISVLLCEYLLVVVGLYFIQLPVPYALIIGFLLFFGGTIGYQFIKLQFRKKNIQNSYNKLTKKPEFITHNEGFLYRDLNNNGKLDVYEDPRQPIEARVNDLLSQMTLEEKTGLLFNHFTFAHDPENLISFSDWVYDTFPEEMLLLKKMNTFTIFGGTNDPHKTAQITNKLQELASRTRLGIPITFASDPRHHYDAGVGSGAAQLGISRWPEQLGLAATREEQLVKEFGSISAKEYRAQGIHLILGPMADVATSPMWGRNYGTFGEEFDLASSMTVALVNGMQNTNNINETVLCQVKHFPGGGPEKDGWDSHFPYGKEQIYPSGKFENHLKPFKKSIEAGVSQIMPYYSIPVGLNGVEEVGFNFNKPIITDLLRNRLNFNGVVGTDFSVIKGTKVLGFNLLFPKVWGVERLRPIKRLKKAFDAGVDQIGGETCVDLLTMLVKNKEIPMERIDDSCKRVLRDKFKLGLFDNPYVNETKVSEICGIERYVEKGVKAQQKSIVLLKNGKTKPVLPLQRGVKIYSINISKDVLKEYATIVSTPEEADFAIIRKEAPSIKQYRYIYEKLFKQGRLDFPKKEKAQMLKIMNVVPTILDIGLDRPVVVPELNELCEAFTGHFGCEERIFLDMIFGEFSPSGKLPISLPKSMEAVNNHLVDKPLSKEDALYLFGHGLTYED